MYPRPTTTTCSGLTLASIALGAAVAAGGLVIAQEKTVDQGVYTTAQANRGQKVYETQCTTCHRDARRRSLR